MSLPRFAIVGHPNKGKSSIVATLAEDDSVAISPEPGTTKNSRTYPMRLDGVTLYELIDTPGFQRAREVLAWLNAHDRGAGARTDVVREFVTQHDTVERFHDECQLLRPILDGAGILYVVDGSRPYGAEYEPEMEVLRWTGRPRMALINMIGSGDHVDEWRAALSQFFSIVRVFDAMHADFDRRVDLLRAFGAIDETWLASLNKAADALAGERARRKTQAAAEIADLMVEVLTATETAELADENVGPRRRRSRAYAPAQRPLVHANKQRAEPFRRSTTTAAFRRARRRLRSSPKTCFRPAASAYSASLRHNWR